VTISLGDRRPIRYEIPEPGCTPANQADEEGSGRRMAGGVGWGLVDFLERKNVPVMWAWFSTPIAVLFPLGHDQAGTTGKWRWVEKVVAAEGRGSLEFGQRADSAGEERSSAFSSRACVKAGTGRGKLNLGLGYQGKTKRSLLTILLRAAFYP